MSPLVFRSAASFGNAVYFTRREHAARAGRAGPSLDEMLDYP